WRIGKHGMRRRAVDANGDRVPIGLEGQCSVFAGDNATACGSNVAKRGSNGIVSVHFLQIPRIEVGFGARWRYALEVPQRVKPDVFVGSACWPHHSSRSGKLSYIPLHRDLADL